MFGLTAAIDAFLPLVKASTYHDRRIVNLATGLSQVGVAHTPGTKWCVGTNQLYICRAIKSAVNIITAVEASALMEEKANISVVAVCPGYCMTNLQGEWVRDI